VQNEQFWLFRELRAEQDAVDRPGQDFFAHALPAPPAIGRTQQAVLLGPGVDPPVLREAR
jgi:hypothetical protein